MIVLAATYPALRHIPGFQSMVITSVATSAATWGITNFASTLACWSLDYIVGNGENDFTSVDINDEWSYILKND